MKRELKDAFSKKELSFIPYITVGDPNIEVTLKCIEILHEFGADVIELGIPYSDSAADGDINQRSFSRALKAGFKFEQVFELLKKVREKDIDTPVVLFGHMNPFLQYGIEKLAKNCEELGVKGLLILDLPFELSKDLQNYLKDFFIDLIFLISPTTSLERVKEINKEARGFLYMIARVGVTGNKTEIDSSLLENIKKIREEVSHPLALGFGLSTSNQVKKLKGHVDAFVVGSAITQTIEKGVQEPKKIEQNLRSFLQGLLLC